MIETLSIEVLMRNLLKPHVLTEFVLEFWVCGAEKVSDRHIILTSRTYALTSLALRLGAMSAKPTATTTLIPESRSWLRELRCVSVVKGVRLRPNLWNSRLIASRTPPILRWRLCLGSRSALHQINSPSPPGTGCCSYFIGGDTDSQTEQPEFFSPREVREFYITAIGCEDGFAPQGLQAAGAHTFSSSGWCQIVSRGLVGSTVCLCPSQSTTVTSNA